LNLYYCFGCKAGGNVVQFVMEMERLSYLEAVKLLTDRIHMQMPEIREDPDYERRRSQRERLLSANKDAARFYHDTLWKPEGRAVLDYLHNRGLTDGVIRRFGLGASTSQWDDLTNFLTEKGYTREELNLAGLTVVKEDSAYDMFRSRVMFPGSGFEACRVGSVLISFVCGIPSVRIAGTGSVGFGFLATGRNGGRSLWLCRT
jgi:DNA primase